MGVFNTRPRFQDRDIKQLSGDTITLSGDTNIAGSISLIPGAVTGYVIKAIDSNGTFGWQPVAVSADTNTFVTGGTLTGTDLILGWNTGGSATPVDLSGLSFTGNTSGNCITDLYVTNIYGCSPITIHDNIQNVTSSALTGTYINVFGNNNKVTDIYSTNVRGNSILGGQANTIDSLYSSVIVGGVGNSILRPALAATYSGNFIGAGANNTIYASYGYNFIGAGKFNTLPQFSDSSVIVGGSNNSNLSSKGFIGSGVGNTITDQAGHASIVGGYNNTILGQLNTFIGGGRDNIIGNQSYYSIIGGGEGQTITGGTHSIIGGGAGNQINYSTYSFIGGGGANYMNGGDYHFIGGGKNNQLFGSGYNIIVGGYNNIITGTSNNSTILGGINNTVNNHNNSHIIGSNLTSVAANTTHVDGLNINTVETGTSISFLAISSDGTVIKGSDLYGEVCSFCSSNVSGDTFFGTGVTETSVINTDEATIDSTAPYSCTQWCAYQTNGELFGSTTDYETAVKYENSGLIIHCCDGDSGDGGTDYGIPITGATTTPGGGPPTVITGLTRPFVVRKAKKIAFLNAHNSDILNSNQVAISNSTLGRIELSTLSSIDSSFNSEIYGSNLSSILSSENGFITNSSNSTIISSQYSTLNGVTGSTIIGGNNITGTENDTVYVPKLNIDTLGGGASINNLGIDVNGNVVVGTAGGGGIPEATTATTTTINFTGQTIYYDSVTPATGNISEDLTGAKLGLIQKIYHNDGTEPTYPAGWVLMGDAIYFTSTLNIIYAEWAGGSRVEYWYVQEQ